MSVSVKVVTERVAVEATSGCKRDREEREILRVRSSQGKRFITPT